MSNSEPTPGNLTLPLNIDHSVLGDALDQLLTYAEQAHAVFLDATRGWAQHGQLLTDTSQQIAAAKGGDPSAHLAQGFIHCIGHETYTDTIGNILDRIKPNGPNEVFLARMLLISLYSLWETKTRNAMAAAARVPVSQVTWSVFGDLRHLRHAILHNSAVADARVARAESCQWFKEGDEIIIRRGHLVAIIAQVKQLRDRMKEIPDFIKHGSA